MLQTARSPAARLGCIQRVVDETATSLARHRTDVIPERATISLPEVRVADSLQGCTKQRTNGSVAKRSELLILPEVKRA
jgi:hypothetical protein